MTKVKVTALSELLAATVPKAWSARELSRQAGISHETAAGCLSGRHGVPHEDTLLALSRTLDISLTELRYAAHLPPGENEPWTAPIEANRLTVRQRKAIEELIRSMVGG